MSTLTTDPERPRGLRWFALAILGLALLLPPFWNLSQYWLYNPLYGYGLWVPLLGVLLAWRRGVAVSTPLPGPAKLLIPSYLLALPVLRVVQIANPDWRMIDWLLSGGAVVALLALTLTIGGTALLRRWWLPIALLLTAVPWSTSGEHAFTAHSMPITTTVASELLWCVRVPVVDQGAMLHTALGPVKVGEDCSGIRGVQLALMAGVFWAGWMGLRNWRAVALVGSGVALALVANLLRVSAVAALTIRSGEIATADRLHDSAGTIAQLALTLGLPLLGLLLRRAPAPETDTSASSSAKTIPLAAAIAAVAWVGASEVAAEAWFRSHEASSKDAATHWAIRRPLGIAAATERPIAPAIGEALRYSAATSMTWSDGADAQWALYWLDFDKGALSACTHNFHRPDLCLPSNDYTLVRDLPELRVEIDRASLVLHHSIYQREGKPLHLFHTTVRESAASDERDLSGWTLAGRLDAARNGRRSHRSQMIHLLLDGDRAFEEARAAATQHLQKLLRLEGARDSA